MSESVADPNAVATVETPDGRVFSGVGVSEASIQEAIDGREAERESTTAVEPPSPEGSSTSQPPVSPDTRDPSTGQFKKGHNPQKRIGQLTAQREDAERRAAAAEQRAQEMDRRLAALEAQRSARAEATPPTSQTPTPAPPVQAPQTRPKPSEDEVGAKYATYADFAEDLADWKVEQRLASLNLDALVRTSIEADRASRTQQEHMRSFGARGQAAYPDFDAVLSAADVVLGDTPEEGDAKIKVVLAHPQAEHLLYAIAKDRRLQNEMKGIKNHLQLGYFLGRIPLAAVAPPAPTAPVVASQAPAPYQPVGSSSRTSTPTLEEVAASGDYEKYRSMRAEQRKRRA